MSYLGTYFGSYFGAGGSVAPVAGAYYDSDDDQNRMLGKTNAEVDADLNSDGDADVIRATRDEAHADAKETIDSMLMAAGVAVPAADSAVYFMVHYAAKRYSAVALDRSRGVKDQNGRAVENYPHLITEANAMMDRLIEVLAYASDTATTSAPVAEVVTLYPRHSGCFPAFGPVCG